MLYFVSFLLGSAGDALAYHRGMPFTTKDRDNDKAGSNCASLLKGAWWYNSCYTSNLNGLYRPGSGSGEANRWSVPGNFYGMKSSEMKMRPNDF